MKNVVITGANAGIGFETAKGLYADGHNIIIGSRNTRKNEDAAAKIKQAFPTSTGKIQHFELDLALKASVQKFSQFVKKGFNKVDILINNAGLLVSERQITELGVQKSYTTNYFGHFYLTYLLFPLLKNSEEARIINVSSLIHQNAKQTIVADPECKNAFSSMNSYAISKLANVQFTVELANRLSRNPKGKDPNQSSEVIRLSPNIKVFSLHPGLIDTEIGNEHSLFSCFKCLCCCCFKSPEKGAATSLFLARSKFANLQNGSYYDDCQVHETNHIAHDNKLNQDLWQLGQKLYGIKFQV